MRIQSVSIKQVQDKLNKEVKSCIIEGIPVDISKQKTGYGFKSFLNCPLCNSRREKLYLYKEIPICRQCYPYNIYNNIQNSTKGGEPEIHYRMLRVAKEYGFKDWEFPFNYMDFLLNRPKYYRVKKWEEGIRKMQVLENMRFQNILYKNRYTGKDIERVFKHRLCTYNLREMKNDFINWYD